MRRPQNSPLTKTQVILLGYGYASSFKPERTFSLREVATSTAEAGSAIDISNLYTPAGRLATLGFLYQQARDFHDQRPTIGRPSLRYGMQEAAIEPLIAYVMHRVRAQTETLPDILRIPESIDALVAYADFFGRLESDLLERSRVADLASVHILETPLQVAASMAQTPAIGE